MDSLCQSCQKLCNLFETRVDFLSVRWELVGWNDHNRFVIFFQLLRVSDRAFFQQRIFKAIETASE